jgi:predicted small lipoprotein YifL
MSNTRPAAREKQHSVRKALLLGCVVAAFGTACGQRGPLYLPEPVPQPEPQPAASAATDDMQSEARKSEEDSAAEKDAEEDEDNE